MDATAPLIPKAHASPRHWPNYSEPAATMSGRGASQESSFRGRGRTQKGVGMPPAARGSI